LHLEQQISRSTDNKRRKNFFYSGKKKKHTAVKTQLMVNNHGFIIHKVGYKKGRRDMTMILIRIHPVTPKKDVVNVFDLGYLGVEKDYPQQKSSLSCKKKRNHELSHEEKEYNKNHSKRRIER
jgi:hypothetical protein